MTTHELVSDLLQGALPMLKIASGAWVVSAVVGLLLAVIRDSSLRPVRMLVAAQNDIQITGRVVGVIVVVMIFYSIVCLPLVWLIRVFAKGKGSNVSTPREQT
jgi:ABC-type amino acid transport system permease subunit